MSRSSFFADILDRLSEQKWTARPKDHGYVVTPPVARPGHQTVFIHDPGKDSGAQKVLASKLRQAGLKFDDEEKSMAKPNGANAHIPAIAEHANSSPFVRLRTRIGEAMTALADMEEAICEIEKQGVDVEKIREFGRMLFK